jgi:small subunit ribosomal protein S6
MLILDSGKYNADPAAAVGQVHGLLEKHGGEILASRPWDERRLAYPIAGHKKGTYYLIYYRAEGKSRTPIERDFALNEIIVRSLTLRIDRKLVDTMLALARDEHAMAIQTPGLADEPVPTAAGPADTGKEEEAAEQ